MTQKWNLQDIRPAGSSKTPVKEVPIRRPQQDIISRQPRPTPIENSVDNDVELFDIVDGNKEKKKRVITTTVVVAIILIAGFTVNIMLGGADVTIYPKVKDISVQSSFSAYTNPDANKLAYELLTLESTGEKQVQATGKEKVTKQSEGKIFVYNTKSTSVQRLIKNTRFETSKGLVFRIKESIEVPGAKTDSKGTVIPGSISADVFSDGVGEQYNIPPQKFTVPGLKDTEQYANVYAESTSQFTGGFDGDKYIIDENVLSTAEQELHLELRNSLLEKLKTERPAGFVIYNDAIAFTFEQLPAAEYGDSLATIKVKARLQVPMFKESDLSSFLAESTISDYSNEMVSLVDPQTLLFTYESPTTTVSDISKNTELSFTLKGTTRLVWKIDEKKLQSDLVSLKRADATKILGGYAAIREAKADVRPFWKSSFPSNEKDIAIHTIIEPK